MLAALLAVGVVGATAYVNHQIAAIPRMNLDLHSDVARQPGLPAYTRPARPSGAEASSLNILVAGVDAGESSHIARDFNGTWTPGSHRSDTIMVLHITADRRRAYVISIPRDSWVPIDGYGMGKINAALSYGGPSLFVRTVEQFTGLRMDHVVMADWSGFTHLVDAFGGVRVHLPGTSGITTLDGKKALSYVRERYSLPRGDLDRIQRQQNVLRALSAQAMSSGVLLDPGRLAQMLRVVGHSVAVDDDFTNAQMRDLALSLRSLRGDDITQVTVPVARFAMLDRQSVVIVDRGRAAALFGAVLTDDLPKYLSTHDADVLPAPTAVD